MVVFRWIPLRSTSNDNVYVTGDNMYFIAEGEERPVPQMKTVSKVQIQPHIIS